MLTSRESASFLQCEDGWRVPASLSAAHIRDSGLVPTALQPDGHLASTENGVYCHLPMRMAHPE